MTEIGRPPVLRVLHQGMQVLDHGVDVEALEFLGIVERFAHRIGGGRVGMESADIKVLWPPVAIPVSAGAAGERAFARVVISFCVHVFLRSCSVIFFELLLRNHCDVRERLAAVSSIEAVSRDCYSFPAMIVRSRQATTLF